MVTARRGFGATVSRLSLSFLVLFGLTVYAGPIPFEESAYAARPAPPADAARLGEVPYLVGPGVRSLASFSGQAIRVPNARSLIDEYRRLGYRLTEVRHDDAGVPRVFLTRLPQDLPDIEPVSVRKSLFIRTMLPLVLRTNEEILADRARIERLRRLLDRGAAVAPAELAWLNGLADSYGLDPRDLGALLHRHDVVPVGLALAQGIEESGWGSSRFALQGNAVFGQWTFKKGAGMVPRDREEGARHEVKVFDSLSESVRQYVHNLNSHRAYREFRRTRASLRANEQPLDSRVLAQTMNRYSERGAAYVKTILQLIRSNDLARLDRARLRDPARDTFDS